MATYKILGKDGYNAQNHEILALLGFIKGKLPPEGMGPRVVTGVRNHKRGHLNAEGVQIAIWVLPSMAVGRGMNGSRPHRIMCGCPGCGKEMSVGRLFQHVCKEGVK